MTQTMPKINNLIEEIKNLTLADAYQLVKELEKAFEIEKNFLSPIQVSGSSISGAGSENQTSQTSTQEKTSFDIILNEVPGDKKIGILKIVRTITGLGLKESKDIVDNIPKTLKEGITKEECEKIKAELETAGAKVLIK